MSDLSRQSSPKSSPRGARSPAHTRQDSTGTLKTTITLGKKPSVFQGGTFYLMTDPPEPSEITGLTNLMAYYGLENSYNKFNSKKPKEELSALLPNLPGNIDLPGNADNSSLRSLIERPPITGQEFVPLSNEMLSGFRLHPGPLPEQYRVMHQTPHKKKNKKNKKETEGDFYENQGNILETSGGEFKKVKKSKRTDEERKKRKKERKKRKEREREVHSNLSLNPDSVSSNPFSTLP